MMTPGALVEPKNPCRLVIPAAQLVPRPGVLCVSFIVLLVVVLLEQKVVVPRALDPAQRLGVVELTFGQLAPHGKIILKVGVSLGEVLLNHFPAWACARRERCGRIAT